MKIYRILAMLICMVVFSLAAFALPARTTTNTNLKTLISNQADKTFSAQCASASTTYQTDIFSAFEIPSVNHAAENGYRIKHEFKSAKRDKELVDEPLTIKTEFLAKVKQFFNPPNIFAGIGNLSYARAQI